MPAVSPVYPLDDIAASTLIDQLGDDERIRRKADIDRAFAYYEGRHRLPLRAEPDGSSSSVILNLVGQALDDLIEFMGAPRFEIPGAITRALEPGGRLIVTRADHQRWLDDWWDQHDLAEFVADLTLSGFIAGHVFVRLHRDADGQPDADLLDPRAVTVFWEASNLRRPLWYRLTWQSGDSLLRQDIVPNRLLPPERCVPGSLPDGWQILEYQSLNGAIMTLRAQDAWNAPFAPIVEWKNRHAPHQYYGRSDARLDLNDAVNFTASNVSKILKHHAGPQTIVTGARLDERAQTGPGTIINDLPADAKVYNLEMQSDLASSLAYLDKLEARFFSAMQVVDLGTIKDRLGQITNFGVRMLFIRMTNLIEARRRLYGRGLEAVSSAVIALSGQPVAQVNALWPDALPVNRLEQVQALTRERALGVVSRQTASADLGRDFDAEQARLAVETGASQSA